MPTVTYKCRYSRCSAIPAQRQVTSSGPRLCWVQEKQCVCVLGRRNSGSEWREQRQKDRRKSSTKSKCGCHYDIVIEYMQRKLQIIPRPVKRNSGNDETDHGCDWAMGLLPSPCEGGLMVWAGDIYMLTVEMFALLAVSIQSDCTEYHKLVLWQHKPQKFVSHVILEVGKFKIKALADLVSGESLPGSWMAILLVLTWWKGHCGSSGGLFYTVIISFLKTHPHDLATSPKGPLLISHHVGVRDFSCDFFLFFGSTTGPVVRILTNAPCKWNLRVLTTGLLGSSSTYEFRGNIHSIHNNHFSKSVYNLV